MKNNCHHSHPSATLQNFLQSEFLWHINKYCFLIDMLLFWALWLSGWRQLQLIIWQFLWVRNLARVWLVRIGIRYSSRFIRMLLQPWFEIISSCFENWGLFSIVKGKSPWAYSQDWPSGSPSGYLRSAALTSGAKGGNLIGGRFSPCSTMALETHTHLGV